MTCTPRARAAGELAERVELGELGAVARVVQAAGTERVAERDGDVVRRENLEHVVEALVERVLAAVLHHPHRVQRAAAADDPGDAAVDERQVLEEDAGVERHVVHALPRLVLDDGEEVVGGHVGDVADAVGDDLVDRHRADRDRRGGEDRLAHAVDVAPGREVHHRVGAVLHGEAELGDLFVGARRDRRGADVGVDLHPRDGADAHRLERAGEVADVGGDDEPAGGHLVANGLGRHALAIGDERHRWRDLSAARVAQLRHGLSHLSDSLRRYEPDQVQRDSLSQRAGLRGGTPVAEEDSA